MTTLKTLPSDPTGLSHIEEELVCLSDIDCFPVWVDDKIQLFDMYYKFNWIGSRRLLRYCEEVNEVYRNSGT